jgi:hypothetical protein
MFGIVGSGFGLYGYLPAVVLGTDKQILLLSKSLDAFKKRPELQFCKDRINWIENEEDFYSSVETLVLCLPPAIQFEVLMKWGHLRNIKNIILEKPISTSPTKSKVLIEFLENHNKKIIVGYSFQYNEWASRLNEIIRDSNNKVKHIEIEWLFKAYHYRNDLQNWKRDHNAGGGAIRFFGIHIIALLSFIGYSAVIESKTNSFSDSDFFSWKALFKKYNFPTISVNIDTKSTEEKFSLNSHLVDHSITNIEQGIHPFDSSSFMLDANEKLDFRVVGLKNLVNELLSMKEASEYYEKFKKVNKLWGDVEKLNLNTII